MTHFFERRDRWGNGLALWVVVGMAFLVTISGFGLRHIEMENDVADWLDPDNPAAAKYRWLGDHFPREDGILVSWEESHLRDPRIERLAEKLQGTPDQDGNLRGGLKQVSKVRTPGELIEQMTKYDVTPLEATERLAGVLVSWGKLRVRLTGEGRRRSTAVKRLLEERARRDLDLAITLLEPQPEFEVEVTGEGEALPDDGGALTEEELFSGEHDFRVDFAGLKAGGEAVKSFRDLAIKLRFDDSGSGEALIEDCFFQPETPVAILVYLTEEGIADRKETLLAIRAAAEDAGIEPDSLHLGGRLVAGAALNSAVGDTGWNSDFPIYLLHKRSIILLSGLVGICLTFYLLRSFRLGMLVLAVSYITPLVTVALVPVTGGSMNMVLVVMPSLLLVLTISGSIHVANYWKHAAARNMSTAVVEAVRVATRPCLLASLTTAIGLSTLATSNLTPVRDFGIYSALGILFSFVMVLYALPAMLQLWPAKQPQLTEMNHERWSRFAGWIAKHSTPVVIAFLAVCVVGTAGLYRFRTETKVIKYFAKQTRIYQDYTFLEENLSGIVPVDIVVRFDGESLGEKTFAERAELVREVQSRIRRMPDVSGTLSLVDFLPKSELPGPDASRWERIKFRGKSRTMEDRVKGDGEHRAGSLLTVADDETKFNNKGDELWRITAQVAILSDLNYSDLMVDLDRECALVLRDQGLVWHEVTGMVPLFLETQNEVLWGLIRSFGLAFIVIGVVLMVVLKNPLAGFLAMLPNVVPIGFVFGLISWCGVAVDIGTMITASVALGVAVDGSLHLLTWFNKGIREGKDRAQSIQQGLAHCGPAMWQTSLVTSLGMVVLLPAELSLISRFGWLMASLIAAALVADIVLLPALLAGPLGKILQATGNKAEPAAEVCESPAAVPVPYLVRRTSNTAPNQ